MRKPVLVAAALLLGLAGAVALWWLDHYRWAGGFRTVTPHFAGTCKAVEGVPSPEDLLIDSATGVAYISSYDRSAAARGAPEPGAILAYDLNDPSPDLVNLTPEADAEFRPHGISLYRDATGDARLFVVNHPSDGDAIELFDLTPEGLAHRETLRSDVLTSLNDIVAVGERQVYVTNSRRHSSGLLGWIEANFRMSWGNVVYYDGQAFSVVLPGVAFPNGINADRTGAQIYLVSSFDQAVHVYRRDATSGGLTFERSAFVGTRLDNLDVAQTGDLWVAGRAQYFESPQPSQVVRIRLGRDAEPDVEEVYVNRGDELGNASVAAVHGRHLLIGSSRGTRFLHCLMAEETLPPGS